MRDRAKRIYIVTVGGSVVNAILLTVKFIAGFAANSHAMVADAFHSLSDFVTDMVVLVFVRISSKPRDKDHAYGHGKFETLATAIVGLVLLIVGALIFWDGAKLVYGHFTGEELQAPKIIAFWVAILSIVLKEALYWWTITEGRAANSQAVIANAWHHRTDALSSIGVAAGIGGAIFLGEKWRVLDPLMAIIVSFFIIGIAFNFVKNAMDELLEKSLPITVQEKIMNIISQVKGCHDPHDLRTRRIGSNIAIEVHLRFDPKMTIEKAHDIATEVEERLKSEFGAGTHVVTHLEV